MKMYDFKKVADAALADAEGLLSTWLSGGRKNGHEWQCGNLNGDPGGSLSVNLRNGVWSDFATGEKGSDLVSLYAAIYTGNNQGKAVRELGELMRIDPDSTSVVPPRQQPVPAKARSPWVPILPVPADASPPPKAHVKRGLPDVVWAYRDRAGNLLGYVCRFTTSDGKKDITPLVYAKDTNARGDSFDWRWMQFPEPRPLYGLEHLGNDKLVLIVEGEKCTDAAHKELKDYFDVISWPGGGNAAYKADWSVLSGRNILIWPDTDSLQNKDKTAYLNFKEQPGLKAALKIADILLAHSCTVALVHIEQPGVVADGWDVYDAIASGLKGAALRQWIVDRIITVESLSEPDANGTAPAKAEKGSKSPARAAAKGWHSKLLVNERYVFRDCRENVVICLENHPKLKGCLGYNEFTARVMRIKPLPWNEKLGEWTDNDDLELSDFLAHNTDVMFNSLPNIAHGVQLAAHRNKFHPLQDYLNGLEWDGEDRLTTWLVELLGVPDSEYARLVGPLWLRQAVNRAINPGCKADYVLILEGEQGQQKSGALRALGGSLFSDARLDLGSKDLYQVINGVWIHEIAELDAFNRSEANAIKAFITRPIDRYRLPYEKRMIDQARHTVFAGTTNNYEYHKDTTGNRRFWSVRCSTIHLDVIERIRDQLLAQALHEVRKGEPVYPTRQQEKELIAPEQEMREIQDAWEQIIEKYLEDPAVVMMKKITTRQLLLNAIGMEAARINPTRQSETKVGAIMHKLGWEKRRESSGGRGYYYARPEKPAALNKAVGGVP